MASIFLAHLTPLQQVLAAGVQLMAPGGRGTPGGRHFGMLGEGS